MNEPNTHRYCYLFALLVLALVDRDERQWTVVLFATTYGRRGDATSLDIVLILLGSQQKGLK